MVFQNNFTYLQPLIQAVRRCQVYDKARGDNITSKSKDALDKKKEQKTHIYLNATGTGP